VAARAVLLVEDVKHLWVGLLLLAGYSACVPCDSEVTRNGLAPRPQYDNEIDACITRHSCAVLCREVFALDPAFEIEHCGITAIEPAVAHISVRYYDAGTCSGDDDTEVDITSGDDGSYSSDDGSTDESDDGSTDTGSDDSGSDSGSDTSGSDGSDSGGDSGGDSGAPRVQRGSDSTVAPVGATR
jgi:hypothetical protein